MLAPNPQPPKRPMPPQAPPTSAFSDEEIDQIASETGYDPMEVRSDIEQSGAQTKQELYPKFYSGQGIQPARTRVEQPEQASAGAAPNEAAAPAPPAPPSNNPAPEATESGIAPEAAAAMRKMMAPKQPKRRQLPPSHDRVPPERMTPRERVEGEPGASAARDWPTGELTDQDIQNTSDLMLQRSQYEDTEVREPYGPHVPTRPSNISNTISRKLANDRNYDKSVAAASVGGGRLSPRDSAVQPSGRRRSPRWHQHMQRRN